MEQKTKYGRTKAIDAEARTITSLVSTYEWDRMTERFSKGAWDFTNYLSNPVVLWAHDQSQEPIAKCLSIAETDEGVIAVSAFDPASESAMRVFSLYQRGFLSGFSVGFLPKSWELQELNPGSQQRGIVYTRAEMLEYSCVPVPANPGCIVVGKSAQDIIDVLGEASLEPLTLPGNEKGYMVPVGPQRMHQKKELIETSPRDFEASAKYVIDLSKTMLAKAKTGEPIAAEHLALMKNAMQVFSEMIPNAPAEITPEQLAELSESVKRLGAAAARMAGVEDENAVLAKLNAKLDQVLKAGQPG